MRAAQRHAPGVPAPKAATPEPNAQARAVGGKTVQEYIDERPAWADGTATPSTPMTAMQWRIWALVDDQTVLVG